MYIIQENKFMANDEMTFEDDAENAIRGKATSFTDRV